MNKLIRTLLCSLLLLCSAGIYAQKGLQIADVFQKYGNRKGSTYVELSKNLSKTWDITHYQSLKMQRPEGALSEIYRSLEADREHAKKIKEVVADGNIQSGYYQLPPIQKGINRYILFRLGKKGEATLIYIEGEIDSDDLLSLMFNKD
ncbi:hypothetical protein FQ707_13830 [Bacteroidaceae bacterium HV4-6-C5C]|jgi:hypothetical protein|nr:hypothetical protein FQ707_13830 [Bacteroidaceae bacterium HV4-6-C5C]